MENPKHVCQQLIELWIEFILYAYALDIVLHWV